jgi:hypothetical protein
VEFSKKFWRDYFPVQWSKWLFFPVLLHRDSLLFSSVIRMGRKNPLALSAGKGYNDTITVKPAPAFRFGGALYI